MPFDISNLDLRDLLPAARLWESGWHDAHAEIVPADLTAQRTSESFVERLRNRIERTRVGVDNGEVLGLCMTQDDELYQMYVAPAARGTGLAQALILDAETRLKAAGHQTAWLACAVGNARAARFYEKSGWRNVGTRTVNLETTQGEFPLEVWRYEKRLA